MVVEDEPLYAEAGPSGASVNGTGDFSFLFTYTPYLLSFSQYQCRTVFLRFNI